MIDAGHELDNLRVRLMQKGFTPEEAEMVCDAAAGDIRNAVLDLVSDALSEAVQEGGSKSTLFIEEVMAVRDGAIFNITTKSGRTDFTEAPFPMLPRLLQNAKVSYDGGLYKRIPMKNKISEYSKAKTIEKALASINKQREVLKAQKDARVAAQRGGSADPIEDVHSMTTEIVAAEEKRMTQIETNATQFRTASSKQDPNSKWVRSGKKADMTSSLNKINSGLHDSIDATIKNIIDAYSSNSGGV